MRPLVNRDAGDECDRCDQQVPVCVVCRRRPYFLVPAPLCSVACLEVFRQAFGCLATVEVQG